MTFLEKALEAEKRLEAYIEKHKDDPYVYTKKSPDPLRRNPRWMWSYDKDIGYSQEEQYTNNSDYFI
jgi:hypothetical protein